VSDIRIVRDYPQSPATVWRAVTDPALIPRWTATGAGGRPEGFAPVAGTRFRFVARPRPGWSGVVDCEVLEARAPSLLRYSWADGAGGRPEGFEPVVGCKFRFVAKPKPGWNGIVDCEVLEVDEPSLLRYSWTGDDGGDVTQVVYRLEPHAGGTRFSYEHTGFTGVGGLYMATLLGRVRRKMLTVGLPAVLDGLT
jgi:uncharacterized protein YndB with AHSA1/START domain